MKLVDTGITMGESGSLAEGRFGDLVKAVVDPREGLITRLREWTFDCFVGPNGFGSSNALWHRYFHAFGVAAALARERARAS